MHMTSWHELYERDGRAVAEASGLVPLDGKRRLDVLRREPAEYLRYRMVWAELRAAIGRLVPGTSRTVDGELVFRSAEAYRQERAP